MSTMSFAGMQEMLGQSPFQLLLGMTISLVENSEEDIELTVTLKPEVERFADSRQYHGGVIASLIDVAGDFALIQELGYAVPTMNLQIDYLRPAFDSRLRARPRIRRVGRSVGVVDIDIVDDDERLIAIGRGTYSTKKS